MKIYGVINHRNEFIDTSNSERGAKYYASINGYTRIGYRVEYNVIETHRKIDSGKWVKVDNNN